MWVRLLSVLLLVLLNGFFVAAEFALVTVRHTRIDQLVAEGHRTARLVQAAIKQLDRYIAGTQVGITLASLALGWIGEPALAELLHPLFGLFGGFFAEASVHTAAALVAFAVITFMHVIIGELVPKSLALQRPETIALLVARPLSVAVIVLQPLIWSLNSLGNLLLSMIGLQAAASHEAVHSAEELELLVGESHEAGVLGDRERRMLMRTFRFGETKAGDIMVPRTEMLALDLRLPATELLDVAAMGMHSRLPVYQDSIDHITGVLYLHDVFRAARLGNSSLTSLLKPPLFVPETLHLDDLLEKFQKQNVQIAIVLDEYGCTAGMVTLEDIISAVFGEIQDQHRSEPPSIQRVNANQAVVAGDMRLVDINEELGWNFAATSSETIAGFVMERLGRVARVADTVRWGEMTLKVTRMQRHRISEVAISRAV